MRWVWLLVLCACSDTHVARRAARPKAAGELRVMSYNVNFGIAGDPATIDAISSVQPDIVFLQETNDRWQRALVDRLGSVYPHHRFAPPDDWPAGGMGLLSKYEVVALEQLPSVGGPFFAWRVELASSLGRIQVLNVHLHPPISEGGSWVVGYFSTRDVRVREIEHHMAELDPKLPTLIVGDFNEEGDGRAIELLRDRGFADAIAQHAGNKRTWEWPVGSMTLQFQLDHILHDAHFIAVAGAVVEAGRSDHKPIWVDFARLDP